MYAQELEGQHETTTVRERELESFRLAVQGDFGGKRSVLIQTGHGQNLAFGGSQ